MRPMRAPDRRAAHRRRNCRRTTRACRAIYKRTFYPCKAATPYLKMRATPFPPCKKRTLSTTPLAAKLPLPSENASTFSLFPSMRTRVPLTVSKIWWSESASTRSTPEKVSLFRFSRVRMLCFVSLCILYFMPVRCLSMRKNPAGMAGFFLFHTIMSHIVLCKVTVVSLSRALLREVRCQGSACGCEC